MTTLDDQATEREEMDRDIALKTKRPQLPHIGICHWCTDPIEAGCFCDADCQQDYEQRERFSR